MRLGGNAPLGEWLHVIWNWRQWPNSELDTVSEPDTPEPEEDPYGVPFSVRSS